MSSSSRYASAQRPKEVTMVSAYVLVSWSPGRARRSSRPSGRSAA
jgi:hypothetical protein